MNADPRGYEKNKYASPACSVSFRFAFLRVHSRRIQFLRLHGDYGPKPSLQFLIQDALLSWRSAFLQFRRTGGHELSVSNSDFYGEAYARLSQRFSSNNRIRFQPASPDSA